MPNSDPHAWLRPIFRELTRAGAFEQLAPVYQFRRLMDAAAAVSDSKATELRRISPAAQSALLAHLTMLEAQRPLDPSVELWRVRKNDRELVCVAVHLPHGIDLRLLEADEMRRTELVRDAPRVEAMSAEWRAKLLAVGWT